MCRAISYNGSKLFRALSHRYPLSHVLFYLIRFLFRSSRFLCYVFHLFMLVFILFNGIENMYLF